MNILNTRFLMERIGKKSNFTQTKMDTQVEKITMILQNLLPVPLQELH